MADSSCNHRNTVLLAAGAFALGCAVTRLLSGGGCSRARGAGKRVAVVLSGCGVLDGSEITEAVSAIVHLEAAGVEVMCFAPDVEQLHVVNHRTGEVVLAPPTGVRRVLDESARIARGKVAPLSELRASDYSALVLPGGFGAAKNLCDYAVAGADKMTVNGDVRAAVQAFHAAGKPVGMCCIAPVLAAKLVPGCEVTMGHEAEEGGRWPFAANTAAVAALGSTHVECDVRQAHVDRVNKVVTAPAYMCDTTAADVYASVGAMVGGVLSLC